MTFKFNRQYRLTIQSVSDPSKAIVIQDNTLEFEVRRDNSSSVNHATFKIENLAPSTFKQLVKDRYTFIDYQGSQSNDRRRKVVFEAGYSGLNNQGFYSIVFVGDLWEGKTYKQGTEIITELYAMDGGYAVSNSLINISLQGGTSLQNAIENVVKEMSKDGVSLNENNSELTGSYKRGISFNGSGYAFLQKYFSSERNVFIDKNKINIEKINEGRVGYVPKITSETGLLGTPMRSGASLTLEMVFEPRIDVSNIVEIESVVANWVNGQYKVTGISHQGVISQTKGGNLTTTLECFIGAFELNPLIKK
jgi:hypothetical protein